LKYFEILQLIFSKIILIVGSQISGRRSRAARRPTWVVAIVCVENNDGSEQGSSV
jgi:hypothetical protein